MLRNCGISLESKNRLQKWSIEAVVLKKRRKKKKEID